MATSPGLRERKKRRTREAIARAAMTLFTAHGFDAVTVADVARAADVSVKTVFNYFPTKEDLVLSQAEKRSAALVEAVRCRPPGVSLVEPFRSQTMEFLDRVEHEPVDSVVAVPRLVSQSIALRDRLFVTWEQEAEALAPMIAVEVGRSPEDLSAKVVARTLAWTHRLVFRTAYNRLVEGHSQRQVAADLRSEAQRAYDLLDRAFGGFGVED